MLESYRELEVWKRSRALVKTIYLFSGTLPKEEKYGLAAQLRSAVLSVPANIAEGYGRIHEGDYIHHLSMARGSRFEFETPLILCVDLEYCTKKEIAVVWKEVDAITRMLSSLIITLKKRRNGKQ